MAKYKILAFHELKKSKRKLRRMIWIMFLSNASPVLHHMSPGRNLLRFTTAALRTLAAHLVNEKTFYWVRFHSPHRFIPLSFFLSFFDSWWYKVSLYNDIAEDVAWIKNGEVFSNRRHSFFSRVSNIAPSPIIIECLEFWAHILGVLLKAFWESEENSRAGSSLTTWSSDC